jgi:hypothetical protein
MMGEEFQTTTPWETCWFEFFIRSKAELIHEGLISGDTSQFLGIGRIMYLNVCNFEESNLNKLIDQIGVLIISITCFLFHSRFKLYQSTS